MDEQNKSIEGTQIDNIDKAWDMAHAATEERETAAKIRGMAVETGRDLTKEPLTIVEAFMFGGDPEYLDQKAELIENWAGILHDHPVSQKYQDEHPEIQFTPRNMAGVEQYAHSIESQIRFIEEQLTDKSKGLESIFNGISYIGRPDGNYPILDLVSQSRQSEDTEYADEWDRLQHDKTTTVQQFLDFYARGIEKFVTDPLRTEAACLRIIPNEIKSGKASMI